MAGNRFAIAALGYLTRALVVHSAAAEIISASRAVEVVERGPDHRVVEWVDVDPGQSAPQTNRYTEIASGMHVLQDGLWREAKAEWQVVSGSAVATQLQFQAVLSPNANSEGAVDLLMPDQQRLRSQVVGLRYYDRASGENVSLGTIQDCQGELASKTSVVYGQAFQGLGASLIYELAIDHLEQNILLLEKPVPPDRLGLDPATTLVQIWTELLTPPSRRLLAESSGGKLTRRGVPGWPTRTSRTTTWTLEGCRFPQVARSG